MPSELLTAALHLAVDLGWRILPCKPGQKLPAVEHGVLDASTEEKQIRKWWANTEYNLAVATGLPGPMALDRDDPDKMPKALAKAFDEAPHSASPRGGAAFFAGIDQGTINLGWGELRGTGSYQLVPPSLHPSGKLYTWIAEPRSRILPPVPCELIEQAPATAGTGELVVRKIKVPHGERHDYLKDMAVHLIRGGITDEAMLARHLRLAYEEDCEPIPPARPNEFPAIARWAAGTRIARKERNRAEHREQQDPAATFDQPADDALPSRHFAFIHKLAGLPADIEVREVRRYGPRTVDALTVHLSTGAIMEFAHQGEIGRYGSWQRAVVFATGGRAAPPGMKEPQAIALLRSLCRVAAAPPSAIEAEQLAETLREYLQLCEPFAGYALTDAAAKYELLCALRERERFDPFDRSSTTRPALIIDDKTEQRYVRGGELADWFRHKGVGIQTREFPGRMAMVGLEHEHINGREPMPLDPEQPRRKAHGVLYRLSEGVDE
jgi:hypothetical protein